MNTISPFVLLSNAFDQASIFNEAILDRVPIAVSSRRDLERVAFWWDFGDEEVVCRQEYRVVDLSTSITKALVARAFALSLMRLVSTRCFALKEGVHWWQAVMELAYFRSGEMTCLRSVTASV